VSRTAVAVILISSLVPGCGGCAACNEPSSKPAGKSGKAGGSPDAHPTLSVPRRTHPIKIDGELDPGEDWNRAARSGPFLDPDQKDSARPYSEARFLYDDDNLYIALYAADQDIVANIKEHDGPVWLDDAFSIRLKHAGSSPTYRIDVNALGVVSDAQENSPQIIDKAWESNLKLGIDSDGTINDSSDDDEEWVVEASLPFASIGMPVPAQPHTKLYVRISRCDTPKDGQRRCGAFGDAGATAQPAAVLDLAE
jgi:hypothetical protein